MKIAHVSPAYFSDASLIGGGERYVHNLAHAVKLGADALGQSQEVQQTVIAFGPDTYRTQNNEITLQILKDTNPSKHPMSATSPMIWDLLNDTDLIHIHQCLTYFGVCHANIGRTLGKAVVGTDLGGGDNSLMLEYGCIGLLDGLLSISEFAASLTRPYFRGLNEVVIGPVDTTKFSPQLGGIRGSDIVCVGRILPHKGIDRIVDALPTGLRLVVVGRRYDHRYYDLLVKKASGKDVVFAEAANDDELIAIYRRAGLFVHAATFRDIYGNLVKKPELMGLTTIEAMACGVPVAVSRVASLPELADDGSFFRTFESTSDLQRTLEDFRDGRWPSRDASSRARQWATDRYGLEPVGIGVLNFYERVRTAMRRGGVN